MHAVGHGHTDVGRARDQNEDNLLVDDQLGLYVVADGMGGHAAGEVASATAIAAVHGELQQRAELLQRWRREGDFQALVDAVREAVEKACDTVYRLARSEAGHAGMGCTFTMLLVAGSKGVMAHVGDSRLYLLRNGTISQLSVDHTMANELAIAGVIAPDEVADHHYAHVLTRAIGTQPSVSVDTLLLDVLPNDRFLLCSDGLGDHIDDERWLGQQLAAKSVAPIAEQLCQHANERGGHDNVSVVVVSLEPDDPEIEIVDELSIEVQGKFDALQSVFMFEGLSIALLTRVLNHCEVNSYEEGEQVIAEDEPCSQLMIVLEGRFSIAQRGRPTGELRSGDHVGATTLLAPRRARATIVALEMSRVLILRRKPFWALIRSRPWLGVGLLERLGRRLSVDLDKSIEQRDEADTPLPPHELV